MPAPIVSAPLVTTDTGLDALGPEWNALARASPATTVFQAFAWNRAWWTHFSRGKRLRVICLRDTDGVLIGLLPLFVTFWHGTPLRVLRFIGSGASDYGDGLCLPGRETEAIVGFGCALRSLEDWHVFDAQQLRAGGFLRECPLSSAFPAWEQQGEACPYLDMPSTWEKLRGSLGKKTRANIGYYDRALQKAFAVQADFVGDPARLNDEMSRLFALHSRRWGTRWLPGVFASGRVQRFHQDAARALLAQNALRLWTLRLDGKTQAVLYCFAWGGRICYYQGGWEPSLARYSPGTVLTARALHSAVDEGRVVFDFLRGDEPYKSKWTSKAHVNTRCLYARTGGVLALARHLAKAEQAVEHKVKAWARTR